MWLSTLIVAGYLTGMGAVQGGTPVTVQSAMPPVCFVYGEVYRSKDQITSNLSSNCPIKIERQEQNIIMKGLIGQRKIIVAVIPIEPGIREFVYRWGSPTARFDDDLVAVSLNGPVRG